MNTPQIGDEFTATHPVSGHILNGKIVETPAGFANDPHVCWVKFGNNAWISSQMVHLNHFAGKNLENKWTVNPRFWLTSLSPQDVLKYFGEVGFKETYGEENAKRYIPRYGSL